MELIRDLLIQIAIIILPLFLYEAIRLNRYQEIPRSQIVTLLCFYLALRSFSP